MMKSIFFTFIVITFITKSYAIHPEAVRSYRATISQAVASPNQESMFKLGEALKTSGRFLDKNDPVEIQVHKELQEALSAIPGHAEYYRDRINAARADLDEAYKTQTDAEIEHVRGKFKDAQSGFGVMANLPSLETVRVLGEFLSDDRGKIVISKSWTEDEKESYKAKEHENSIYAMGALHSLPIVYKPFKTYFPSFTGGELEGGLAAWRVWYEQVKTGKRTFRFEGDPTDYDLNGPASKDKLASIQRDAKRDGERAAGQRRTADTTVAPSASTAIHPLPLAGILAGFILVAAAVCYFINARKRP